MDNPWLPNIWPYVWMCDQGYVACPTLGLKTTSQHFVKWRERLCVRGFNIGWLGITFIKNIKTNFISILFILILELKNIIFSYIFFPLKQAKCSLFAMTLWVLDMVFTIEMWFGIRMHVDVFLKLSLSISSMIYIFF